MTVNELIEALSTYDGNTEVRLMTQPTWPLVNALAGVVSRKEIHEHEDRDEDPGHGDPFEGIDAAYLLEGERLQYGTRSAWEALDRK